MLVLVHFHGDIEFALLGDELERALDGFNGEIERDLVFVLIGTFPFKDELGLGIWAWLVVDFVFVDIVCEGIIGLKLRNRREMCYLQIDGALQCCTFGMGRK